MNKIYALIFLCLFVGKITCHAQGGVWTWMKGDSTIFSGVQFGNYGIQGVSSPTNEPPGRYHQITGQINKVIFGFLMDKFLM